MNRRCTANSLGALIALIMMLAALSGCWEKDKPKDPVDAAAPVEEPVSEADLTVRLQKEINETQTAIAEAVETQDKLATEIEVLQQLLEETETELATHEQEVSHLEAQQSR